MSVTTLCRVLNVSRSGYYEWLIRVDEPRQPVVAVARPLRRAAGKHHFIDTRGR